MDSEKLNLWKERLEQNESACAEELGKMDHREDMYRGRYKFKPFTAREDPHAGQDVKYVYNALAENIEAQISSDIPMPKVTARRPQDERLAVIIENMLRNELDRLPMETVNDLAERVIPIQGGGLFHVEWDSTKRICGCRGETAVSFIHPKWCIPQDGVYSSVQDMDYIILKLPQTKESIMARYGVDVFDESETEPELKSVDGGTPAQDMVTLYVAYYRNDSGGIGRFSWCGDTVLEDMERCQARRHRICAACGAISPMDGELIAYGDGEPYEWHSGMPCPDCGGEEWTEAEAAYEETEGPIVRTDGSVLPGTESGGPVRVPYYTPDMFPVVLQKNVSVFGRFLGESDADKLEPMQDGINRLEQKIFDRMLKAGTRITMPDAASLRSDPNDQEVWRIGSASDLALIRAFDFRGDVSQEMQQIEQIYQHMRQTVGVTDSYQGRRDSTATSGTAKEFAAAQAAGRMESKRVMKQRAYSELFELMFKFRLAYADEPRPVVYQDGHGQTVYDTFSKWDFLERDEHGRLYWNDRFLFSCDSAQPLASNREKLWKETTSFLSAGAYGDPSKTETLVEYWKKMETLHYPGAAETRANLQERLERERQTAQKRGGGEPDDAEVEDKARRAAMEKIVQELGAAQAGDRQNEKRRYRNG